MRIARIGRSGLFPALLLLAGCAPAMGTLELVAPLADSTALPALYEQHYVPLIVIGDTIYRPSTECAEPSRRLFGAGVEDRGQGGEGEGRGIGGDLEGRAVGGDAGAREVGGDDEGRRVAGDTGDRGVGGDDQSRRVGGGTQGRAVGGDDEGRAVGGDDEGRRAGGDVEGRGLGADEQGLRCRRAGPNAFRILRHEQLGPLMFLGTELEAVPDGYVEF